MKLKIGTRKSKLSMAQTSLAIDALKNKFPEIETEIIPITTKGDLLLDAPLSAIGGKGLFIKKIEDALISGEIDVAVHSAKDLPCQLGNGLEISAVLPRGDFRDVLVTMPNAELDVKSIFTVGTGSLRRKMNFSRLYKNASFAEIRGNVDTRLSKLSNGDYDGIILAAAGLERLNITEADGFKFLFFDSDDFLPAPCQGIIALECRASSYVSNMIGSISDKETHICFEAERETVLLLNGDCSIPLGALAILKDGKVTLKMSVDPKRIISGSSEPSRISQLARDMVSQL